MSWFTLPDDKIYHENKLKGIFLGNFVKWDPYKQTDLMKKLYGWKESSTPFERTYRTISNLDDIILKWFIILENGDMLDSENHILKIEDGKCIK